MTENKQNTWDDMITGLCNEPDIKKCKTREEVYNEIYEYLTTKYGEVAPEERLKSMSDDITESICLKMNINGD